ncbi:MAG: DNA polymerase III subunit chi [Pseudohongiellaceae bacterium]
MSKVNFYALKDQREDARLVFACRLAEKASSLGHKIHIHTDTQEEARRLDDLLWQFRPESFLPHQLLTESGPDGPVLITIGHQTDTLPPAEVLINLSSTGASFSDQFAIINEIVLGDDASLRAGRESYRVYRDAGHELTSHRIS